MIVLPSSVPQLAQATYAALPDGAVVRIGTVAQIYPTHLLISVAEATIPTEAGWLLTYEPILGDVVAVTRQGAAWVVLGSLAGSLSDSMELANYSFEDGPAGDPPPNWTLSASAGSPTLTTFAYNRDDPIDGPQVGALTAPSTATVTVDVLSDPVRVEPGEHWAVAAWFRTLTAFSQSTTCSLQVFASWYSGTDLGTLLSSNGSGSYPVTRGMGWTVVHSQGNVGRPAPTDAQWMRLRVAVSWSATAGDTIYFDRMIARRV